jgi:hypothetical protein
MQNLASVRRPSGFQEKSGCRRMRLTVPAFFEGCLVGGSVANPASQNGAHAVLCQIKVNPVNSLLPESGKKSVLKRSRPTKSPRKTQKRG